ncbi:unnamed protein product [Brugia timori]|uniref:PDZ domain-containing protein n=1 Tax=Brugia timori TaxID=42155 RepID=A0A0R3QRQ1_9BILA|nr:unnamed protein product [Brugia timori]
MDEIRKSIGTGNFSSNYRNPLTYSHKKWKAQKLDLQFFGVSSHRFDFDGLVNGGIREDKPKHYISSCVSSMTNVPKPRLCRLRKRDPTEEFGFNLHAEKNRGHFVGAVDKNGIGERAGLQMGQRIVGVNGQLIYPSTAHKEVVSLIKKNPLRTELLVASEEIDQWYTENHMDVFNYIFKKFMRLNNNHEFNHEFGWNSEKNKLGEGKPCSFFIFSDSIG